MELSPGHLEPVPRRIRAVAGGRTVVDTLDARYLWEHPRYPQYLIPLGDVRDAVLVDEGTEADRPGGRARTHGLRVGDTIRAQAAHVYVSGPAAGGVRFAWDALDAWYEEDEPVVVHPRDPYTRVDVLRSSRHVVVELDGVVLAESVAPVALVETRLPTRWYLDRTCVAWEHLRPSATVTSCPYKGKADRWWSTAAGVDVAWSYDHPTREALPIAGLVAFYNERIDLTIDGRRVPRPVTHFS